jgi:hypothetical protein
MVSISQDELFETVCYYQSEDDEDEDDVHYARKQMKVLMNNNCEL